jgi:hypothetical protein
MSSGHRFPAFDTELDGISNQTMEITTSSHEGRAKKANESHKILEFDA